MCKNVQTCKRTHEHNEEKNERYNKEPNGISWCENVVFKIKI